MWGRPGRAYPADQAVPAAAAKGRGPLLFAMTHSASGGLREIWSDIAHGLDARGHAVGRFVLYPPADAHAEGAHSDAWHHVVEHSPRSPLSALILFFRLRSYLRRLRPAAVVTAMPAANVLVPLAIASSGLSTRVYVSHHSPTHTHNRLLNLLDGWTGCLRCVAGVISVSDAVAATLESKPARYRAKRRTIHNALPESIERLVDAQFNAVSQETGAPRIVSVGRLTHQKNYPMLLHAVARLDGVVLDIIGGGEDEAALRELAADLGIGDRVIFAGWMSRAETLTRIAGAEVFVQVSRYEGHSLALIEAARIGLPLIVSDIPEQVEAITDANGARCGIAVPLMDVAMLARTIATLLNDSPLRSHWAGLSRQIAVERSNTRMIDHYEDALVGAAHPR